MFVKSKKYDMIETINKNMKKNEIDKMQDVLEKHFRDEKTKWFMGSWSLSA